MLSQRITVMAVLYTSSDDLTAREHARGRRP
ncbi:MAG: hypothetical protein AAGI01_17415 [Myxococcota bacterium]